MKFIRYINLLLSSLCIGILISSCVTDYSIDNPSGNQDEKVWPLVVYAEVGKPAAAQGRANTNGEKDDQWSYVSFADGDRMGLFASGGNMTENNGSAPFVNQQLVYQNNQFNDPENKALFSPVNMNANEILMYFPYNSEISEQGTKLRVEDVANSSGPLRCIDFLYTDYLSIFGSQNGKDMALFGEFHHAFSELILMRGEGFDNPPEDTDEITYSKITIALNQAVTHVSIINDVPEEEENEEENENEVWNYKLILTNDGSMVKKEDGQPSTVDEAYFWHPWKGENYQKTEENPEGQEAYYVILPTLPGTERLMVDYIELYDNEGYLQRITSIPLSGGKSKYLDPKWRYPLELTMEELVPKVNPYPIMPWDDNTDLTDERTRGINDLSEFESWVSNYNAYLADPTDENKMKELLKYGDKIIDDENNISWHFYVLADLDLSSYKPLEYENENGEIVSPSQDYIIPKLNDILDGVSSTLVNSKFINHSITGLKKTFIGEIGTNPKSVYSGTLQNFDFLQPEVSSSSENAAGIIVSAINNGEVINCNIDRGEINNPNGPAGMVAGTMNEGKVADCELSGFLYGLSTSNDPSSRLIIGEDPIGSVIFNNNSTTNVISSLNDIP
ncbi:MAG: fimbrillin family protein [Muribaculaceae bacterium]|nr:fimbrillin family protein [Muribaculaceae bacterium]